MVIGLEAPPRSPPSDRSRPPAVSLSCDVHMSSGDVSDPAASSDFPLFVFSLAEDSLSSR